MIFCLVHQIEIVSQKLKCANIRIDVFPNIVKTIKTHLEKMRENENSTQFHGV